MLWKPGANFKIVADSIEATDLSLQQLHLDRRACKEAHNKLVWLSNSWKLSRAFDEELVHGCVHVLVQLPDNTQDIVSQSRRLSTIGPLEKAIIRKHVDAAKQKDSPSSGPTPSAFPTTQANNPILNGRPFPTRATPVHLYHEGFTAFTSLYNDKDSKIPSDIQADIYELCQAAAGLYKPVGKLTGDDHRLVFTRPIYRRMLDEPILPTHQNGSEPDGVSKLKNGKLALRGVFEDRNEIGAGGSDPSIQGCLSYIKYWSADELEDIREKCCCPSFVIATAGPWIAVHGAVLCDAGWIVQPLTDLFNLQFDPFDSARMLNIGRLFLALRKSLQQLETFYTEIENQSTSILWPMIRTYEDVQFEYLERLVPKYLLKAVFRARTLPNNESIVVKFTNSYSADAHRLLEKEGLAPKLRYFSGDDQAFKKPGGLEMVVMDFVEDSKSKLTRQGREDIQRAISLLHEAGYVFGDLRKPNIFNLPNGHAMLIDFDWSGKEGQVFYPMGLNMEIDWAVGTGVGKPILKAHDLFMLDQL